MDLNFIFGWFYEIDAKLKHVSISQPPKCYDFFVINLKDVMTWS